MIFHATQPEGSSICVNISCVSTISPSELLWGGGALKETRGNSWHCSSFHPAFLSMNLDCKHFRSSHDCVKRLKNVFGSTKDNYFCCFVFLLNIVFTNKNEKKSSLYLNTDTQSMLFRTSPFLWAIFLHLPFSVRFIEGGGNSFHLCRTKL